MNCTRMDASNAHFETLVGSKGDTREHYWPM